MMNKAYKMGEKMESKKEKMMEMKMGKKTMKKAVVKKVAKKAVAKKMGKKVAGVVPLLGTAYGLMSGDPAMASEEAAGDIPVIGQAYEAIKPAESGNPEEERMIQAEDKARKAYKESPARMAKLQAMMKGNK
jgi:hypothetical protein